MRLSRIMLSMQQCILFGSLDMYLTFSFFYYFLQLARLPHDDTSAVYNMKLLEGSSDTKKSSIGPFALKFDVHKVSTILLVKIAFMFNELRSLTIYWPFLFCIFLIQKKHAFRKDRTGEEVTWQLSRFYPMIEVSLILHYNHLSSMDTRLENRYFVPTL